MKKIQLYVLMQHGIILQKEFLQMLAELATQYGKLQHLGTGSAYNIPSYLLKAIERRKNSSIILAMDMDEETFHPRALIGKEEVKLFIEALKANLDGDSWEIAVETNKQIRKS